MRGRTIIWILVTLLAAAMPAGQRRHTVMWRNDPIKQGNDQQADIAFRADIDIPSRIGPRRNWHRMRRELHCNDLNGV